MFAVRVCIAFVVMLNTLFAPFENFIRNIEERFAPSVSASVTASQGTIVMEASTGAVISEDNADEIFPAGHLAKLMTLLVTAEAIDSGELAFDKIVTVSAHANSMQGAQIWLDAGEKISVEELVKAITIGNANDACVALAEAVADSETDFTEQMNIRAVRLGMESTYYADCTGISKATTTTARDTALLCAELSKHDELFKYMTTWLDSVRDGKAQLVNTNRLIRSYKGIIGMKACAGEGCGNCLAVAAVRDDMTVVAVMTCSDNEDTRFQWAKEKMNIAFAAYEIYYPQPPEEALAELNIICGEKPAAEVDYKDKTPVLIPKGSSKRVKIEYERVNSVRAPVNADTIIGSLKASLDGEIIFRTDIFITQTVNELSYSQALKMLLLELLKF